MEVVAKIVEYRPLRGRKGVTSVKAYCAPDTEVSNVREVIKETKLYAIPEGWTLVPVDPTPEMLMAGYGDHYRLETSLGHHKARQDYAALIKFSPSNGGIEGREASRSNGG